MNKPPVYFAIFHTPGPNWDWSKDYREQPGVMSHVEYMSGFSDAGKMVFGGPFLDGSGGMMILDAANMEEAEKAASENPTVKSGLLKFQIRPWMAVMVRS